MVLHVLPLFSPPTSGAASPLPSGQEAPLWRLAMPDGHKGWEPLLRRERNLLCNLLNAYQCHMALGETGAYLGAVVISDQSSKVL